MQHKPLKKERLYCRSWVTDFLGVTSDTLKSHPIPYIQYSRFGYTFYKLVDLKAFQKKSIHNLPKQSETPSKWYQEWCIKTLARAGL